MSNDIYIYIILNIYKSSLITLLSLIDYLSEENIKNISPTSRLAAAVSGLSLSGRLRDDFDELLWSNSVGTASGFK